MQLFDRLLPLLDPLHDAQPATRDAFAVWYREAKLPQIRSVAFLTMLLFIIYALLEQNVAQDHLRWRLLAHAVVLPLMLLGVGLLSYAPAHWRWMHALLCVAPVVCMLITLWLNSGHPDFAYYAPEIYLNLIWTFTVSGLTLRQASLTATCSTLAILVMTLGASLQPGMQRLHLLWVVVSLSFGALCAFVLQKAHKLMFLQQSQLALNASLDGLTGLWNRLRLDQCLDEELERARRYGTPFSVILLDIDHFKRVNDVHGHLVGDRVLRQFATLLREHVRSVDKVGRLGGEEFLVILPQSNADQAVRLARALREQVHRHEFDTVHRMTASFGVAQFQDDASTLDLLERADRAMYRVKANGRDEIAVEPAFALAR